MRDLAKKTILASGALKVAAHFRNAGAAVLMYHSVQPEPAVRFDLLGGIVHSKIVFRGQMQLLAQDYRPLALDEAIRLLRNGNDLPKRSVVVTFDDGYADNYAVAMPVLNQTGVPAAFYVTVDCVESGRLPWPARLRFAFRKTQKAQWRDASQRTWKLNTSQEKEKAFAYSCDVCCRMKGASQNAFVSGIENELDSGFASAPYSLMMTYEELSALHRNGHTIGSHTMTHPNMAYLAREEAKQEFSESKRRLELNLGISIRHFSYPCPALSPHWNSQTLALSRTTGYESAVTTDGGLMRDGDNFLCLKRIRPTKTVEGLRWNLENAFAGRAV